MSSTSKADSAALVSASNTDVSAKSPPGFDLDFDVDDDDVTDFDVIRLDGVDFWGVDIRLRRLPSTTLSKL